MSLALPVLLIFVNAVVAAFLIALFFSLKRYEKNLNSFYSKGAKKELERAKQKASEIIEDSQIFSKDLKDQATKSVDQAILHNKQVSDDFFEELYKAQDAKYQEFLDSLTEHYTNVLEQSKQQIEEKTVNKKLQIESELEKSMQETLAKIKEYKQSKLTNIDKESAQILEDKILKTLPEYISIEDKQKLLTEVVEKAKQTNFFKQV
jgi:F0F1-type ATP synthase membrane subunit b/b'